LRIILLSRILLKKKTLRELCDLERSGREIKIQEIDQGENNEE